MDTIFNGAFQKHGTNVKKLQEKVQQLEQYNSDAEKIIKNLKFAYHEMQRAFFFTLQNLFSFDAIVFYEDACSFSRIAKYSELIARKMGLDEDICRSIMMASATYDVGKLGIPVDILFKPGRLDDEEFGIVKMHTVIGGAILGKSGENNTFSLARKIALAHHEHWDGKGYPLGLKQDAIPIAARIVSVADSFDALVSRRPYREAYSVDVACDMIKGQRKRKFDPDVVDVFTESVPKLMHIRNAKDF